MPTAQTLVHQALLIFLLCICRASTAAQQTEYADDCLTECGGVSIPYPFGIGPDQSCYYDEWFQIDCNESTGGKPFLRLVELEVLNFSIKHGTLQVNIPLTFFCEATNIRQIVDLTDSPFVYSQSDNKFTALSCDCLALVISENTAVGGCRSVCDKKSEYLNCERGINCCQTSIPPYLTIFVTFSLENTTDCNKFAFVAEKDWFEKNTQASTISEFTAAMRRKRKVPVALDWRINNDIRPFELFNHFIVDASQYRKDVKYGYGSVDYYVRNPYGLYHDFSMPRYPRNPSCHIYPSPVGHRSEIVCSCSRGFEGNPYLGEDSCHDIDECQDHDRCPGSKCVNEYGGFRCEDKRKAKLILATGLNSSLGLLFFLAGVSGVWFGYKFLKKRNEIKRRHMFFKRILLEKQLSSGNFNVEKIKLFKSHELEKSTDNFNVDRIVGQGGQGTVYKGMLKDGRIVAVKKAKLVDESQLSEFINEVVILSQISHRNVVELLGCCLETEVPLLVYEFIPNGTLSKYLTEQSEEFPLTWKMRIRIAREIAGALSHLHYTASRPIYHRDIKSTNILMDDKYRAKVADFGTSRSIAIDQTHLTTPLVQGTFGYLDPEYFDSGKFTDKSDVYSFGVVLVELLTGQKPISFLRSEGERSLAKYFIISMDKDRLFEIVDAQVLKEGSKEEIIAMANLARRCLNMSGKKRPTMREVTTALEVIQMTGKASNGEQNYEELVEMFLRTESVEPWDIASSSMGICSTLDAGRVSSPHEIPLLTFKTW